MCLFDYFLLRYFDLCLKSAVLVSNGITTIQNGHNWGFFLLFYLIINPSPDTQKENNKRRKIKKYVNKSIVRGAILSSMWFLVTPNCFEQTIRKNSVSSHINNFQVQFKLIFQNKTCSYFIISHINIAIFRQLSQFNILGFPAVSNTRI